MLSRYQLAAHLSHAAVFTFATAFISACGGSPPPKSAPAAAAPAPAPERAPTPPPVAEPAAPPPAPSESRSAEGHGGTGYHFHLESDAQLCLDARGDSGKPGTEVWLYKCNESDAQRWAVTENEDGWSTIVGPGGQCLDVRGASTKSGAPLQTYPCHFKKNQRFHFKGGEIIEEHSGKCLGVEKVADKQRVRLEECNGSWNRKWLFEYNRK